MRFDDRVLMAFAYGELSPVDAARIAEALEEDSELAARVARFRNVRTALRKVYDSVAEEPVPEHLRALLGDVASSEPPPRPALAPEPLPQPPLQIPTAPSRRVVIPAAAWAAIAAALMVGIMVGRLATPEPLFVVRDGHMRAGVQLARALNDKLSTDPATPNDVRFGGSFYAGGNGTCRTFTREAVSGIACREGDDWTIRFAVSQGEGGDAGPALMAMVDTIIDGEPLTPAEEAAARARHWTR